MKIFTAHRAGLYYRYIRLFGAMLMVALMATSVAMSIQTLNLLSTSNFVILAGSTVTGIPPVSMTGDVGLYPAAGSYIAGFDGTDVTGILYVRDATGPAGSVINATLLLQAKSDLTTAYNDAAGRTPVPTGPFLNPNGGNIGGLNLVPGLYKFTSDCQITGADVTLTGNATDVWIFQIASLLNLGSGIHIILAGGAQASNIFWQVGTSATLGTYSVFKGTILADQSISLGTGATMEGRALAFTGAVTMASGVTTNRPELVTTAPIFSVNRRQIAFGSVSNGFSKMDSVTVTNTGTADLIINNVTSSNMYFTVTPTSGTITPGSTQKYYVTFSPNTDGTQNGNIIFNHNAANAKDTVIVNGKGVTSGVLINPTNLNFGDVYNNITKTDSVTVTNTGTGNLIISSITSSNTHYTIFPLVAIIKPNSTRKFYITFAPLTDGLQYGNVIFNHNAANGKDTVIVSGIGVSSKFTVSPTSLDFGNVNNAITKMDSVTVTNTGTADLIITSITSSNTHFTITPFRATIRLGSSQKFYITFTPLTSGLQNGYIRFNFNATNAKDSIHVTGTGVGSPVSPTFTVNPLSLDFGNVNTGTTKLDSVTITNTGTANLTILGNTSSNAFYTTTPGIAIIAASASQKFYIIFAPLKPGLQDGYIYFYHNATNGKDSIHVTGNGVGNDIAPKFSASTSNLDFGTVFIGTTKQKSVIVTNTGATALIIWEIISSDDHYAITPILSTVAPGASQEFFITFAPTVVGQLNAKFIFVHNAGQEIINVTGIGLDTIPIITINAARELPIGTEFITEGTVTRTLGSYTRIQDETGAITILQPSGNFFNEVQTFDIQMGDFIRVQGSISEIGFLKVINGTDLTGYQRLSRLNLLPIPVKVSLSEIANNGEQYESRLITLDNLTIESGGDNTFHEAKTYQVTDTSDNSNTVVIRIGNSADTFTAGMVFIGTSVTFEGVLSQSSVSDSLGGYQLTPVLPSDLRHVPTGVSDPIKANQYSLSGNYPNPFNSSTRIQYTLGIADFVSLKVFDVLGQDVATLVNGFQDAGTYTVPFSVAGNTLSSGSSVYFYRLEVGPSGSTKKMILVK
jgi:hypothetical protein